MINGWNAGCTKDKLFPKINKIKIKIIKQCWQLKLTKTKKENMCNQLINKQETAALRRGCRQGGKHNHRKWGDLLGKHWEKGKDNDADEVQSWRVRAGRRDRREEYHEYFYAGISSRKQQTTTTKTLQKPLVFILSLCMWLGCIIVKIFISVE